MPGIVHLLMGAAIAILIPSTPLMLVVAFFSHYLLDLIPHIDPATFAAKARPYTITQKIGVTVDVVLVVSLALALFLVQHASAHIFLGALAGLLHDLLSPLEEYSVFSPLKRIHRLFHWDERRAKYWDWYLFGLVNPIVLSIVCLFVIAKSAL